MDLQSSRSMHPHNDLSPHLVELLDFHFRTHEDLSKVSELAAELKRKCADLDSNISNLNKRLTVLFASWTCRSYGAKISIHQLNCELQKLMFAPMFPTSQCLPENLRSEFYFLFLLISLSYKLTHYVTSVLLRRIWVSLNEPVIRILLCCFIIKLDGTETVGSRKIQKLLGEELPQLATKLQRFIIVGKYAGE